MTMIEKVARALNPIAWAAEYNPEGQQADWERQDSLKQARAAIEAMRPGKDAPMTETEWIYITDWIDAALAEKP